ncbi:hypothetical protein LTR67_000641 [Exophiala xenobiotica]
MIYAVLFIAADVLSNFAISASSINGGSPVLWRAKGCGIWNQTYLNTATSNLFSSEQGLGLYIQYAAKQANDVQLSLEYSQECYMSPSASNQSSTCHAFRTSNLTWETRTGLCPFQPQICHGRSRTVVLDTGYIDSHDHLGINAKPEDRMQYRRRTTCAVLNSTNHVSGWDGAVVNASSPRPPPESAYAHFGPSIVHGTDWTYSYSNFASFFNNFTEQVTLPYQLDTEQALALADPQWSSSDFEPIPEVAQSKADLVLFFLSFTGMYLTPVQDPWFSAHHEESFDTSLSFLSTRYARDSAISTLGCIEQHQFCLPNAECTEALGFDQVQNDQVFNNALTPYQNATFDRVLRAVAASRLSHLIQQLAVTTNPLLASNVTLSGKTGSWISLGLPQSQWEMELQYWHSISMAQLQRTIVQWATGRIAPEPQDLQPPTAAQDIWFCENLIVPSTVYQSFDVVAIILVITLGMLVVFVSLIMEPLAASIRKFLGRSTPRQDWDRDNVLRVRFTGYGGPGSVPRQDWDRENVLRVHFTGHGSPGSGRLIPTGSGYRAPSPHVDSGENIELSTFPTTSNNRDMHPPQHPLNHDQVDETIDPNTKSPRGPVPASRSARESWITISLESVHTPSTGVPSHISDDDVARRDRSATPSRRHLSATPSPRRPPLTHRLICSEEHHRNPRLWV